MAADRAAVRIVTAAVMHSGKMYEGSRHGTIMQEIWETVGHVKIHPDNQGFVTSDGRFVNRFQAGAIAFRSGQRPTRKTHLLSEDVW